MKEIDARNLAMKRSKRVNAVKWIWAALVVGMACGCASVKVYKVDVDAQGKEEVNEDVEGIPYYMPRPYLAVYEPFVVDTAPYFVTAQLTSDGKYMQLASLPAALNDPKLSTLIAVPGVSGPSTGKEVPPTRGGGSPGVQLMGKPAGQTTTNENNVPVDGNSAGNSPTNTPTNTAKSPSTNAPSASNAGKGSMKVTSTADYYITPTRRFFDIVYLPDYTDKRIIQVHSGLGQANLSVTLAQGWSLALNATVDNSALANELFKTWDTGLQLAQKAATAFAFPPAGMLQGAVTGPQITCKLIDSTMVAPGLYALPKDVEYPAKYGLARPNISFVEHLGLKTYHVYTVQALTPTGDSPLNFTLYSSEEAVDGGAKAGTGTPTPATLGAGAPDLDALAAALNLDLATNAAFAAYAGQLANVTATTGKTAKSAVATLHMKSAPADQATSDKIAAAALKPAQDIAKGVPGAPTIQEPILIDPAVAKK
jgi:hypothetical protein